MTTVAWDGKYLAADKRTSYGGLHGTTTKVHNIRGHLIAGAGMTAYIEEMLAWFERGALPEELPSYQRDEDKCAVLLMVDPQGVAWVYQNSPYPTRIENPFWAIGSGRDFAIAAMHLGCSAVKAIEITSIYETGTGNGVDAICLPNTTPG